jgi:hypothetical protein
VCLSQTWDRESRSFVLQIAALALGFGRIACRDVRDCGVFYAD